VCPWRSRTPVTGVTYGSYAAAPSSSFDWIWWRPQSNQPTDLPTYRSTDWSIDQWIIQNMRQLGRTYFPFWYFDRSKQLIAQWWFKKNLQAIFRYTLLQQKKSPCDVSFNNSLLKRLHIHTHMMAAVASHEESNRKSPAMAGNGETNRQNNSFSSLIDLA